MGKSGKFIIISIFIFLLLFSCGGEEKSEGEEVEEVITSEEKTDEEIEEIPTLPIDEFVKEFKGRRIMKDEYTKYDYIYVKLDDVYWTLWTIADLLLDDPYKWPILAEYNNIKNPRRIYDGTEIRIPIRKLYGLAELTDLHNKVLFKLKTSPEWTPAKNGQSLCVGDGIRTLSSSRAVISFYDGSELRLNENSLIFIANISESVYERKVVSKINLEKGTLNVKKQKLDPSEVFEVKTTETKVHASEDNISDLVDFRIKQMREKEETLVMSYKGKIDVEAMDSVITLSSGEGSMVKKNDRPINPVKLLEAPLVDKPEMNESFNYSNIEIVWDENKDAEHYRIEISNDPEFKKVVKIYNNHKDNRIYDTFIEGEYFIRICAIDKYAFEGYWSRPLVFRITNSEVDEKPPNTEISLVDGNPTFIAGGIYISGDKYIQLKGNDDTSGIRKILYCINDTEERIYKEPFRLPVGSNKLKYYSVDRSGKIEEPITIIVNVDISEPETRIKAYCQK